MINKMTREELTVCSKVKERYEDMLAEDKSPIDVKYEEYIKDEFKNHILELREEFIKFGVNTDSYLKDQRYKRYTHTDYKLTTLNYLLHQFRLNPKTAQILLNDFSHLDTERFKNLAIFFVSEPGAEQSLGEIKRGIEEGLDINEIAVILGKNMEATHDNRKIYVRYRDFFRGKINSGHAAAVKQYLNAVRSGNDNYTAAELVLHAKSLDDLKTEAPAAELSWQLYDQMTISDKRYGNAFYIEVPGIPGEETIYKCFASDGNFQTCDEETAAKWVCDRNSMRKEGRIRTAAIQTGVKSR